MCMLGPLVLGLERLQYRTVHSVDICFVAERDDFEGFEEGFLIPCADVLGGFVDQPNAVWAILAAVVTDAELVSDFEVGVPVRVGVNQTDY
jgi:hypothetical protein